MAFGAIKGEESSTITFKARTITQNQNSTVMHQEIVSLGGTLSTLAIAAVLDAAPASTEWGIVTRPMGYSTIVSVAALPANSSLVAISAFPSGLISSGAPAGGSSGLIVRVASHPTDNPVYATISGNSTVVVASGNSSVTVSGFASGLLSTSTPAAGSSGLNVWTVGGILSSVGGVVAVTPNSTAWVKNAGLSVDSSNYLNVNASFTGSTQVEVRGLPAGMISSAAPAANDTGLFVRVIGYSTIVSVAAMPAGSTTVTISAGNSSVTVTGFAAGLISSAAPAGGSSGLVVWPVGYSTIVSVAAMPANSSIVAVGSFAAGLLSTAAPAANSSGLNVWVVGGAGQSTIVTVAAMPANSSIVAVSAFPSGLLSTVAPSSNSSGLIVRQVIVGPQTFASTSAFATSTLAAINSTVTGQKCKVFAYSLTSTDLTASDLAFYKGSSLVWPVVLQAGSSLVTGANLAVSPPGYLFATAAGSSMTLRISGSSRAGWRVGVSYFMEP